MKHLSKLHLTAFVLLLLTSIAIVLNNGCKTTKTGDLSNVSVNPAFEMTPPMVGDITIQQVKDNKDGNVLLVADFGKTLGQEKYHALMLGEEKIVLRDDGEKGDVTAGDGKFSIVLQEDINEMQKEIDETTRSLRGQKEIITFSGRTMVRLPLESFRPSDFTAFKEGKIFTFPPFFRFICSATTPVLKENSLMVTAPSVVEDTFRTFNPCKKTGNASGAWAFPKLISEMANTSATSVSPSDFLKKWLESWLNDVTVNADLIAKRTQINNIINTWNTLSGGTFDIKFAPFKLIAIVNRVDLRGNTGYGVTNPGEGRFVFCAINCNNGNTSVFGSPAPFMVIFEYGLPQKKCATLKAFAKQWSDLSGMTLGSAAYNNALENITNQFTMANTSPSKPNGSSLNQIRTNELALNIFPWELREFNIDSASHFLKNVTVKQEPQVRFNKRHPDQVPADVETMANFVNTNTPSVEATAYTINEIEGGKNFLAGKAHTLTPDKYHWNGDSLLLSGPEFITSDSARFVLSLNTCSGCHGGEAFTGNFMHVAPGGPTGVPAFLSNFLKGNPPMSAGPFVVNDRANRPKPPGFPGTPREFNDLERRKKDLETFVSCPCSRPSRVFEIADILRAKPLNMTH